MSPVTSTRPVHSVSFIPEADADDAILLGRICEGNHAAFALLVRRYGRRCYHVAYRFVRSRVEAEDIVQEAFAKLWERPSMWQRERNVAFIVWFHRVVVNLCLDRAKKKKPLPLIDDAWIMDEHDTQEEMLIHSQQRQRLEHEIAALPERQRIALNLCFSDGLSNQEAADVMNIGLKALQSLLMRAKMTLKEKLKDNHHDI